jgi:ankyrin repeat protein
MEAPTELLDAIHLGNFALINDVPNEDINIIDSKGYSIMHYAVTYNNLEVIKILIKRKGA